MTEVNPRYQDDWLVLIGGPQLCKTSFGVNCQLLWIWENKSRFSERELRKVLGPYNIWTHKHSTYHWPLKFPFYNKACLKVYKTEYCALLQKLFFIKKDSDSRIWRG